MSQVTITVRTAEAADLIKAYVESRVRLADICWLLLFIYLLLL